ncbi:MAG: hypothetical protein MJZ14_02570 [Paludibacteraceae bacterium]|nr:hypothetical protein [Paludibacteraceae bacterium]
MMGILSKHISTLLLLFGMILPSVGQELSSHIINNLIATGKKSPYSQIDNKDFVIVSIDSLSFGNMPQGATAQIDFKKRTTMETTFRRGGGKWNYSNGKSTPLTKDRYDEFAEFLLQFSQNKDFQVNHTIFPFPTNIYVGKTQTNRKLTMPRDWNQLNFTQAYPQMIHFKSDEKGTNRKIYIYKKGRLTDLYNFIYINKQWYLIEKYVYE